MCGIIGLLTKSEVLQGNLGQLLTPMFTCMAERGPDSAGCAFFAEPVPHPLRKFSIHAADRRYDWQGWRDAFRGRFADAGGGDAEIKFLENHAVVTCTLAPHEFRDWLGEGDRPLRLLSVGRSIDVYKDAGDPEEISARYRFAQKTGSHGVGHTRMATESAVTPAHSHPFTAGEDFCLVHNGSLSNPYMLRRRLEREGLAFETDNDTEAACRYLQWQLRDGADLESALSAALADLDGFFTLLIATIDRVCLVRDAFACKPAVVAETDDYVAISSEFRSLAHLPGIENAQIFEPKPEQIYLWEA